MASGHFASAAGIVSKIMKFEIRLIWLFICTDLIDTLALGISWCAVSYYISIKDNNMDFYTAIIIIAKSIIYNVLYLLSFTLCNQLSVSSIMEDRINKPFRPLAAGLISRQNAMCRKCVIFVLYVAYSHYLSNNIYGLLYSLLWEMCIIWYNFLGGNAYWMSKNFIMMIGYISLLSFNWQIVQDINSQVWLWIMTLPFLVLPAMSIQDFRDVEGDKKINRRTMPIVWGNKESRIFISLACMIMYPIGCYLCVCQNGINLSRAIFLAFLTIYIWFVSLRLMYFQDSYKQDNITYQMWASFFVFFELSALVSF